MNYHGGEQQRVSIARALVKQPNIMFCDEPTGALDEKTGKKVLQCLIDINEKMNTTMVIVTHNPGIAKIADRILHVNSGKIDKIIINDNKLKAKDIPWG
jgi:putative ABC transport system ATP-binding protein